ncbi:MAG: PID-CTERM protein-sorting domain-containing protein [Ginsengibacter sp.]
MYASFKRILIIGISLFIFICSPVLVKAQGPLEPPCVGDDPQIRDCPIDSGLLILIVIGAAYGIKKVVDSKRSTVIE